MLEIEHLDAFHGLAQALFGVSLRVQAGEVVVLRGLNGAGKSTLLQSIMGMLHAPCQHLSFAGQDLRGLPSHSRAQLGLGYVAEDRRLFTELTVQENLRIAMPKNLKNAALDDAQQRCLDLFPTLKTMLKRPAAHMSGGEQQMLAIARTLMTQPRLLLLDEPMEGIAPVLVESLMQALANLVAQGMTLLIAEQHRAVEALTHRKVVLISGKIATP